MVAKMVDVPVESETARMLREADDTPLILHVAGVRYCVLREVESDAEARDSGRAVNQIPTRQTMTRSGHGPYWTR
jgi:hypothetical protein